MTVGRAADTIRLKLSGIWASGKPTEEQAMSRVISWKTEPVGLIGLGLLGSALAERLLAAGVAVRGFDVDPACRERAEAAGCRVAASSADVARHCSQILLSLPDSDVSAEVVAELTPVLQRGASVIDTTTGDPEVMQRIGNELAAIGIGYLDATIAGSSALARSGDVLVLVGGDDEVLRECRNLLEAISARSIHVGPRGSGARMKLVVNLVLGLNRAVLAEGLTLARTLGLDPQVALQVLQQSPAASAVMATKGEKMIVGDFAPQARLRQHLKDVRLILQAAGPERSPLSALHEGLLQALVDRGYGDEDNSAVIRAFAETPPTSE
jgi:3-hydroxyisobutyrate dehydrogenase-like beta-hydroxyacid dehydrogenase